MGEKVSPAQVQANASRLEVAKACIVGRGFLGMLVLCCPSCGNFIHVKPLLGTLHVCQ